MENIFIIVNKMKKSFIIQKAMLILMDVVSVYIAFILAYFFRVYAGEVFSLVKLTSTLSDYTTKWWIVGIIVVALAATGAYGIILNVWDDLLSIIKALSFSFPTTWMILSLQKETEAISRIVITLSFLFMFFIIPLFRYITKFLLYKLLDLRRPSYIVVREGIGDSELIEYINTDWYLGYRLIPSLSPDNIPPDIDLCFIPIQDAKDETIKKVKNYVRNIAVVSDVAGLSFMTTRITTLIENGLVILCSKNGLVSPLNRYLKRAFDLIVSMALLLISLPLFIALSIAIRLDSRGPAIFKHRRCGKEMKGFDMYKFRTMFEDSESILKAYIKDNKNALDELMEKNKLKNDPRVTRLGKFLRRFSIDELPQLINVLKGEMSLVGPRPDSHDVLGDFYQEYEESIYRWVKPGITGLWQVSGRSEIEYKRRVRLDYLYVMNWSLWLDIIIVIRTIKAVLSGKGAY